MNKLSFQRLVATRVGQSLKQPLRSLFARMGYELAPANPDESARMRQLISKSGVDTLLDVGANQGQYASHMRRLGFTGHIISYEPGSQAFALLTKHAATDRLWTTEQAAMGETSGDARLNVSRNSVSSSLLDVQATHLEAAPDSVTRSVETVTMRRLDDAVADVEGKFWLKIDTQGYEMAVLLGAAGTLGRVHVVQLEVSFTQLYVGQADWLSLMALLAEHGFTVIDVIPGFRSGDGELLQCDVLLRRHHSRDPL